MQNQPTFKEIKNSSNTYLLKRQPLLKISKDTQKCSKFYVRKKKKIFQNFCSRKNTLLSTNCCCCGSRKHTDSELGAFL